MSAPLSWDVASHTSNASNTVVVDPVRQYQSVLGFGAAFTDASCYLLNSMKESPRQGLMDDLFSPQKMNLSAGRCCVGSSDYSRHVYSYDDVKDDVTLKYFSIAHDEEYILPSLREARAINPRLFLLASPWSPPGWMKTYGSMLGGWMSEKYLGTYAHYLNEFLTDYAKAGVHIDAITSQNEVETDQEGRMPACYWTPEMEEVFVRDHLGPLLRMEQKNTQIWLLDHNYNLWKRVRWQMRDQELRKYVDGVAWHGYSGTPEMMGLLHAEFPGLPFYWTEGGPDITNPDYATEWTKWGQTFTQVLRNWCRSVIAWNLVLDEHGKPNIGPFSCGGLVTLHSNGQVTHSGQYWAMRHFSQHVRRGAIRVSSESDDGHLAHVAFRNMDGTYVLVLTNTDGDREVTIKTGGASVRVTMEQNSMTTLSWS